MFDISNHVFLPFGASPMHVNRRETSSERYFASMVHDLCLPVGNSSFNKVELSRSHRMIPCCSRSLH